MMLKEATVRIMRKSMIRTGWVRLAICLLAVWMIAGAYAAASEAPMTFRFGVLNLLAGVNPRDARVVIEMNIVKRNRDEFPNISAELEILNDVSTAKAMFEQNNLDAIALSGADYLNLSAQTPIVPLFISSRQNTPLETWVLLTLNSVESISHLAKLPKRRLIMEDYGISHIGQLWLDTVLREQGHQGSDAFFTDIRRAEKPARMVLPVFFGQAEACLVPESAYETMAALNPQLSSRLRVQLRSPGFVRTVTCANKDLDPKLMDAMKRNVVDMPLTVDGQQLMMIFQYRRHYLFDPAYMRETERVYRQYHSGAKP